MVKAALAILSIGNLKTCAQRLRVRIVNIFSKHMVLLKTAERVCVDLSDKVGVHRLSAMTVQTELDTSDEAVEALMALGYTVTDAVNALHKWIQKLSTQERISRR